MGGKEQAQKHLEVIRKLVNKFMKECVEDSAAIFGQSAYPEVKVLSDMPSNTYRPIAHLAGKLFDARWEAFVHDSDTGLVEE